MLRKMVVWCFIAAAVLSPFVLGEEKPAPRLKLIFVERFRFEAWDNAVNLDDAANDNFAYTRNRTTLGLRWQAAKNLEILGKITNEFRVYLAPKDRAFNGHELFFDNLYVRWTIPGRLPFTITAGRQDINLGEGFVIADGTPLDGSRSYYFNALRVDADFHENHKLIFFLHAQETADRYLPLINGRSQALAEQPEKALAFYYSGAFGKTKIDAYAVRKLTDETELWPVAGRIDTFGARAQVPLLRPLMLTAEGAVQTGTSGDAGRSAFGGIVHLDYDIEGALPLLKTVVLGGIYLSGDRPGTEKIEGWDPIFSRWPKWSESYIYTLSRESRPSYWSNLTSLYGSISLGFGRRSDGFLMCQRIGAIEPQPGVFPGGSGHARGMLLKGRLNYKISKFFTGRLIWERFIPGSFYFPGASSYNWLQFEMIFRY
ncbi:MAG: hypothetical protein A2Y70_00765 [Candidatus Aminicenantes bacterium RBG_13_64_14]|nr:MAG: hypothetical protein A2Y70_00765 [Candidatus Aminicenantes bacterium RBG_13_64_14]